MAGLVWLTHALRDPRAVVRILLISAYRLSTAASLCRLAARASRALSRRAAGRMARSAVARDRSAHRTARKTNIRGKPDMHAVRKFVASRPWPRYPYADGQCSPSRLHGPSHGRYREACGQARAGARGGGRAARGRWPMAAEKARVVSGIRNAPSCPMPGTRTSATGRVPSPRHPGLSRLGRRTWRLVPRSRCRTAQAGPG